MATAKQRRRLASGLALCVLVAVCPATAACLKAKNAAHLPLSEFDRSSQKTPSGGLQLRGGSVSVISTPTHEGSAEAGDFRRHIRKHPQLGMYGTCALIVFGWVITGTIVYNVLNGWPLATAFFYAVDAGMSIGFCTDVAEHTVRSRAFSILFILLGSSVVGGALGVFMADVLEGVSQAITTEWRTTLERDAFRMADEDGDGSLNYDELRGLLFRAGYHLTEEQMDKVCSVLDNAGNGCVTYEEFLGTFRGIGPLIRRAERNVVQRRWLWLPPPAKRALKAISNLEVGKYRCFLAFSLWISVGVAWGMVNQKWDPITATHFAISALATGGLTAPPVNEEGVLPNAVALFVGTYCLLGIPLFYLTMGHFAKILVHNHLVEAEQQIIRTPLQPYEYQFAKSICTGEDSVVHLSDYIVLHFLRRGMTDLSTIKLIRGQFQTLDSDGDGVLSFEEATAGLGFD